MADQAVLDRAKEIDVLNRALKRERAARQQAESLLESRSRELYLANKALTEEHERVQRRNDEIEKAHTELQVAQAKLIQSEKLASVGQLAAGVAHEINNPIGFIMSNLGTLGSYAKLLTRLVTGYREFAATSPPDSALLKQLSDIENTEDIEFVLDDITELVTESLDGTVRVKEIVQGLKQFSRVDDATTANHNLHEGLESTLKVVASETKYNCTIVKNFGELPPVLCNIAQLNQVFMNLIVNASQAMEKPGEITITTRADAEFAYVTFSDTGSGIAEESIGSIFDPFFTTKPVGSGTGLGLAISYGIVQEHGGTITVDSTVGVGTTFEIALPLQGKK